MIRLFCEGKNPIDISFGTNEPKIVDKWVFLQLAPLIKFVPNFLEDLVLHTFPLPYFLVKRDHQKLYNSMWDILDEAEKLGVKRVEASLLVKEIRIAVKVVGGVTILALEKMPLVKYVIYDETLRMHPPVPFQTVIIVSNHDASFLIKKDEVIFGYQTLAMKECYVFKNAEEFNLDRFVGDGEKLLK
ncbi:hypothetical protein H5410_049757 [Solanum commersonii]|uniref:Uncharacterized protein n=1 Tax=Solanum commersonii TaxID=4109 RepID=A0A9J5WTR4_SOLCO|nr:hypothetical protein H5410_049757 [Solanum commersonii]